MERVRRGFWAVDGDQAKWVMGLATQEPELWWVPEIGYSLWVGAHLHYSREEAIRAEIAELDRQIVVAQGRRGRLAESLRTQADSEKPSDSPAQASVSDT